MDSGDIKNDKANESKGQMAENGVLKNVDEEKQLSGCNEVDDREEGEIVDDYDFIISSDEELCMRRRIEELEAKNEELEKIANISCAPGMKYALNIHYVQKYAKDQWNPVKCTRKRHSEMSDDAYTPPSKQSKVKKMKKRRHKHSKTTNDQERHKKKNAEQNQKLESHQNEYYKNLKYNSDYTVVHFTKPELFKRREENENTFDSLGDRQELRLSNSKSSVSKETSKTKKKHSKKKRSEKRKDCENISKRERKSSIQTIVVDDDSSSDTQFLEEQELRLIALKSAVMKKHLARKKRDAEIAYSPTDFENRLGQSQEDIYDIVDVEMEEFEDSTKDIMDVSPVASPTLYLNSRDSEKETQNNYADENTKLIDMDIANSDSDENTGVVQASQSNILKPLENFQESCSQSENGKSCYKEKLSSASPKIPSPCQFIPISFHPNTGLGIRKAPHITNGITLSSNEVSKTSHLDEKDTNINKKYINNIFHDECNESKIISLPSTNTEVIRDEDEEETLRALLLSRLNSSKTLKIDSSNPPASKPNLQEDDPEKLRSLLLTTMNKKNTLPTSPSESILKEALRRIKMKACSEDGENVKEDSTINLCNNSPNNSTLIAKSSFQENSPTHKNEDERSVESETTCPVDESTNPAETAATSFEPLNAATKKSTVIVRSVEQINEFLNLENKKELEIGLSGTQNDINIVAESNKGAELKEKGQIEKMIVEEQNTEQSDSAEFLIKGNSLSNSTISKPTTKLITKDNGVMTENTIMAESNSKIKLIPNTQEYRNIDSVKNPKTKPHIPKNKTFEKHTKASTIPKVISKPRNTPAVTTYSKTNTKMSKINVQNSIQTNNVVPPKVLHMQKSSSEKAHSPTPPLLRQVTSNVEIPKVQVKKLVITLKTSDTETSEDDYNDAFTLRKQKEVDVDKERAANKTKPTDMGIKRENGEENRLSIEKSNNQNKKRTESPDLRLPTNECFEKKLEAFLKCARSRVQNISPSTNTISNKKNPEISQQFSTPVAVRHLPYTAQQEYCRLIHRMKLLEKRNKKPTSQSQEKCSTQKPPTNNTLETKVETIKSSNITENPAKRVNADEQVDSPKTSTKTENLVKSISLECQPDIAKPPNNTENLAKGVGLECQTDVSKPSNNAENLSKKINLKSQPGMAKSSNSTEKVVAGTSVEKVAKPSANSNVSKAREFLIHKTGVCVITSLDKSLQLVAEAKRVKKTKLSYEKRLRELRSEMEEVRIKMRQEQQRMSKTFTKINESNKVVTALKERYRKLTKSGPNSGNFKESLHRYNNDLKQEIIKKSKLLAAEIKEVNAMKSSPTPVSNILKNKILHTVNENRPSSQNSNDNAQDATKPNEINLPAKEDSIKEAVVEENPLLEPKESLESLPIRVDGEVGNGTEELLPKDEQSSKTAEENGMMEIHEENLEEGRETGKNGPPGENDEIHKEESTPQKDVENSRNHISEYVSPLVTLKMSESPLNPNGIICPYDLMGQCEDKDCHFDHLTVRKA